MRILPLLALLLPLLSMMGEYLVLFDPILTSTLDAVEVVSGTVVVDVLSLSKVVPDDAMNMKLII